MLMVENTSISYSKTQQSERDRGMPHNNPLALYKSRTTNLFHSKLELDCFLWTFLFTRQLWSTCTAASPVCTALSLSLYLARLSRFGWMQNAVWKLLLLSSSPPHSSYSISRRLTVLTKSGATLLYLTLCSTEKTQLICCRSVWGLASMQSWRGGGSSLI